jgi:putative ABC transport system ATP-binding protein
MQKANPITKLKDVTKIYPRTGGETIALHNASFEAFASELVLFLGPSGSGKTTMLTVMAGLQRPTSGEVFLFGNQLQEYSSKNLQQIRASRMSFIFQTFCLLDSISVLDNVMMSLKFAGIPRDMARQKAIKFLDRLEIKHLMNVSPVTLSQGEKQRVAVARALVTGAELIIADEPTGSLATQQGMEIVDFLSKSCKTEGRCVVIASHDERISKYADRVMHLRDGIMENGNL